MTGPSAGTQTAGAACQKENRVRDGGKNEPAGVILTGSRPPLPLVVAACAGGGAGAAGVPSQRVVHLLPQLLSRHLQRRKMLHFLIRRMFILFLVHLDSALVVIVVGSVINSLLPADNLPNL